MTAALRWYVSAVICSALGLGGLAAAAQEQPRPTAAVLPTPPGAGVAETKPITIAIRQAVRARGYRLAVQRRVREVQAELGLADRVSTAQLRALGERLGAELVFGAQIVELATGHARVRLRMLTVADGALRTSSAPLDAGEDGTFAAPSLSVAGARCVDDLFDDAAEPATTPAAPAAGSAPPDLGAEVEREQVERALGARSLADEYREYLEDREPGERFVDHEYAGFRGQRIGGVFLIVPGVVALGGAVAFGAMAGIGMGGEFMLIGVGCELVAIAFMVPGIVMTVRGRRGMAKLEPLRAAPRDAAATRSVHVGLAPWYARRQGGAGGLALGLTF